MSQVLRALTIYIFYQIENRYLSGITSVYKTCMFNSHRFRLNWFQFTSAYETLCHFINCTPFVNFPSVSERNSYVQSYCSSHYCYRAIVPPIIVTPEHLGVFFFILENKLIGDADDYSLIAVVAE